MPSAPSLTIKINMSSQFRGIPFRSERGENLCYCNSGTNALLSSEKLTSQLRQEHCEVCPACDFLYQMMNASSNPRIKSAEPLKALVAGINSEFDSYEQQDVGEFINYVLTSCERLKDLTRSSVLVRSECKICGNVINEESTIYIVFENPVASSMAEIFSNIKIFLDSKATVLDVKRRLIMKEVKNFSCYLMC